MFAAFSDTSDQQRHSNVLLPYYRNVSLSRCSMFPRYGGRNGLRYISFRLPGNGTIRDVFLDLSMLSLLYVKTEYIVGTVLDT